MSRRGQCRLDIVMARSRGDAGWIQRGGGGRSRLGTVGSMYRNPCAFFFFFFFFFFPFYNWSQTWGCTLPVVCRNFKLLAWVSVPPWTPDNFCESKHLEITPLEYEHRRSRFIWHTYSSRLHYLFLLNMKSFSCGTYTAVWIIWNEPHVLKCLFSIEANYNSTQDVLHAYGYVRVCVFCERGFLNFNIDLVSAFNRQLTMDATFVLLQVAQETALPDEDDDI